MSRTDGIPPFVPHSPPPHLPCRPLSESFKPARAGSARSIHRQGPPLFPRGRRPPVSAAAGRRPPIGTHPPPGPAPSPRPADRVLPPAGRGAGRRDDGESAREGCPPPPPPNTHTPSPNPLGERIRPGADPEPATPRPSAGPAHEHPAPCSESGCSVLGGGGPRRGWRCPSSANAGPAAGAPHVMSEEGTRRPGRDSEEGTRRRFALKDPAAAVGARRLGRSARSDLVRSPMTRAPHVHMHVRMDHKRRGVLTYRRLLLFRMCPALLSAPVRGTHGALVGREYSLKGFGIFMESYMNP